MLSKNENKMNCLNIKSEEKLFNGLKYKKFALLHLLVCSWSNYVYAN